MKTTDAKPNAKLSKTNLVAASFVVGAAAFAWFGMSGSPAPHPLVEPVTVAKAAELNQSAVRRLSDSGLPTRIVVASASVDAPISEVGVTLSDGKPVWETAWKAAGHHIDSAMPGQPGNMVITGHVSVADRNNLAAFKQLDQVVAGDTVDVYSGEQVYHYSVSKVMVVSPSNVKLLRSDTNSTVTLITCTHDLKNRLVVVGTLVA
ncbi:MAG: sortase [bacterium]